MSLRSIVTQMTFGHIHRWRIVRGKIVEHYDNDKAQSRLHALTAEVARIRMPVHADTGIVTWR